MKDLLDELVDIAADLADVTRERIVIVYGSRPTIEVLDADGHVLPTRRQGFSRVWAPPGGGFVRILSLETALADALRGPSKRRVDRHQHAVSEARAALTRAEERLVEVERVHARLTAVLDEGVAAAVIVGARPDKSTD